MVTAVVRVASGPHYSRQQGAAIGGTAFAEYRLGVVVDRVFREERSLRYATSVSTDDQEAEQLRLTGAERKRAREQRHPLRG